MNEKDLKRELALKEGLILKLQKEIIELQKEITEKDSLILKMQKGYLGKFMRFKRNITYNKVKIGEEWGDWFEVTEDNIANVKSSLQINTPYELKLR